MTVVVYSKAGCPFCSLLKMEMGKRNIDYIEVDLSSDELRQAFYQQTGTATVPQVYLTDGQEGLIGLPVRHLGGWSEVSKDWDVFKIQF